MNTEERLAHANVIRCARVEIRQAFTENGPRVGPLLAAHLLHAPPYWASTWAIRRMLRSVPGTSSRNIDSLLAGLFATAATIGELSLAQRVGISAWLVELARRAIERQR